MIFWGFNSILEAYCQKMCAEGRYSLVSIGIGAMACHDIVERHSTGLESTTSLCIVDSAEETHAFGHGVTMVPRWTEGIFLDEPTRREDDDWQLVLVKGEMAYNLR
jgi:hypothetical protein